MRPSIVKCPQCGHDKWKFQGEGPEPPCGLCQSPTQRHEHKQTCPACGSHACACDKNFIRCGACGHSNDPRTVSNQVTKEQT